MKSCIPKNYLYSYSIIFFNVENSSSIDNHVMFHSPFNDEIIAKCDLKDHMRENLLSVSWMTSDALLCFIFLLLCFDYFYLYICMISKSSINLCLITATILSLKTSFSEIKYKSRRSVIAHDWNLEFESREESRRHFHY